MNKAEHTCGYHPPASKKALLRALREHGTAEFRDCTSKPCGKPATHVQPMREAVKITRTADGVAIDTRHRLLYLCTPHAKHNAGRGFPSTPIGGQR